MGVESISNRLALGHLPYVFATNNTKKWPKYSRECRLDLVLMAFASALFVSLPSSVRAQPKGITPSQQAALSAYLRHQAELARSAECEYEFICSVTTPDMIPSIREACRNNGNEADYVSFIYTEEIAKGKNAKIHWWRKGSKEREEIYDWDTSNKESPRGTTAFDGQIVRQLGRDSEGTTNGGIYTKDAAHWSHTNRKQPFSFLYEFSGKPYFEIIGQAKRFAADRVVVAQKKFTRVKVDHPTIWHIAFILFFDEEHRLVERQFFTITGKERQPRLYEKHFFSEYEEFKDESGESIWFPRLAIYKYYVGKRADGSMVEYLTETMKVKDIKFNIPISDDKFSLHFPKDIEVWDGVTNLGFVRPAELPQSLGGTKGSLAWVLPTAICLAIVAALTATIIIIRYRIKDQKA